MADCLLLVGALLLRLGHGSRVVDRWDVITTIAIVHSY